MKTYDNSGRLIGEINTVIRPEGGVVVSNTVYSGDRVITQTISTQDDRGAAKVETFYNGKVLP